MVSVRLMEPAEYPAMRRLAVEAFEEDVIGDLLDALRDSWAWSDDRSFVAVDGNEVVGQVLYTGAILDAPERLVDVLVLSPLSVRADRREAGIGDALVRTSLALLADRPEPLLFLEGSPRYYGRFGFVPAGDLGFRRPSLRIPERAFQVLTRPGYEPWMTGTLVYPDAFWRLDSVGLR